MNLRNSLIVAFLLSLCVIGVFSQIRREIDIYARGEVHESTSQTTWILDSFDDLTKTQDVNNYTGGRYAITWVVEGSQYITKTDEKPYPQQAYIEAFPAIMPKEYKREPESMRILGVRGAFNTKGVNWLTLIPTDANNESFLDSDGNPLPGVYFYKPIYKMGLYALGILRDYDITAKFATEDGEFFTVNLGNLNYSGWRVLESDIPIEDYVSEETAINNRYLIRLDSLIVRTSAYERVDDFVVYLDQIFYTQSSMNEKYYDGYEFLLPGIRNNATGVSQIEWKEGGGESATASE